MKTEYIALSMCMRELILLRWIFVDLSNCFEVDVKVARAKCTVFEGNSSVIHLSNVAKMTPRSKHIVLHYHFFREHIREGRGTRIDGSADCRHVNKRISGNKI